MHLRIMTHFKTKTGASPATTGAFYAVFDEPMLQEIVRERAKQDPHFSHDVDVDNCDISFRYVTFDFAEISQVTEDGGVIKP